MTVEIKAAVLAAMDVSVTVCGFSAVDGGVVGAGSARARGGAGADQGGGVVPLRSFGDQREPAAADADGFGA